MGGAVGGEVAAAFVEGRGDAAVGGHLTNQGVCPMGVDVGKALDGAIALEFSGLSLEDFGVFGGAAHDCHEFGTGDGLVGAEAAVLVATDDIVGFGELDFGGAPAVGGYVGVGAAGGGGDVEVDAGQAVECAQYHGDELLTGEGSLGAEGVVFGEPGDEAHVDRLVDFG